MTRVKEYNTFLLPHGSGLLEARELKFLRGQTLDEMKLIFSLRGEVLRKSI